MRNSDAQSSCMCVSAYRFNPTGINFLVMVSRVRVDVRFDVRVRVMYTAEGVGQKPSPRRRRDNNSQ